MDLLVACAAGLSGYLLGGISFARVVRAKTGGAVTYLAYAGAVNIAFFVSFRGTLSGYLALTAGGASQPADVTVDDQPSRAAS